MAFIDPELEKESAIHSSMFSLYTNSWQRLFGIWRMQESYPYDSLSILSHELEHIHIIKDQFNQNNVRFVNK